MRKITVVAITLVAFLVTAVGSTLAFHYKYLAEDPAFQAPAQGTENYAFVRWAAPTGAPVSDLKWESVSAIRDDVVTAVGNWNAPLPELPISQNYTSPVVAFTYDICPSMPGSAGCVEPFEYTYDSLTNASYWSGASVHINPNLNWGPGGRKGVIAHEVGHLYGLSDAYIHNPPGCNINAFSVMDATKLNGSNQVVTCDGLEGPALNDASSVASFWSTGELSDFVASHPYGTLANYEWLDSAWSDMRQYLYWYWWNGSSWVNYLSQNKSDEVGVHRITEERLFLKTVNRIDYPGVGAGWHVACGWPYFAAYATPGTWRCSNSVLVD